MLRRNFFDLCDWYYVMNHVMKNDRYKNQLGLLVKNIDDSLYIYDHSYYSVSRVFIISKVSVRVEASVTQHREGRSR